MLEVKNLDLYYGDAQALDRVSLSVPKGEIVAIVGANGAGKSSLIRSIAGIEKPRSGGITFKQKLISGLEPHTICNLGIGQVAEGRQVFPSLTVLENLQMGAMLPRARASAKAALEEVLRMFPKLEERKQQLAGTLSGGEQQMLALARGLAARPALLMLDELSMGLAPLIVEELYEQVAAIASTGVSIVVVEQFAATVLGVADLAAILVQGRIGVVGAPAEVEGHLSAAYLGASVEGAHP